MDDSSNDDWGVQPLAGIFGMAETDDSDDVPLAETQKKGREEAKFGTGRQIQEGGGQNSKSS